MTNNLWDAESPDGDDPLRAPRHADTGVDEWPPDDEVGLEHVHGTRTALTLLEDDEDDADDESDEFDFDRADDQEWEPEMGFPDPFGILMVWLDEDDIISRVRISPHWRARLGHHTLLEAIGPVFLLINNYRESKLEEQIVIDQVEAPQPLSWDSLAQLRDRSLEIATKLDALPDDVRGEVRGQWTTGDGLKGKVRIVLNPKGRLATIMFDEKWLATARIKELGDGIAEAHRRARAAFEPPTFVPSEREELIAQLTQTRNQLAAMLRRGFN